MKLAALQAPSPAGDMDMAFDTLAWALHAAGAAGASIPRKNCAAECPWSAASR